MNRNRLLLTTLLGLAALGSPAGADEISIRVPGDRAWSRTGIHVRKGDRIEIRASGSIDWGKGEIGPEGTSGGGIFRPINTAPAGGLIGRVGTAQFFLGDDNRIEAPADGELELGINDDKLSDNSGEFRVRVRTELGDGSSRGGSGFGHDDDRDRDHGGDWSVHPGRSGRPGHGEGDRYHDRDTFWWRGRVDGTDQLVLQGRSLRVKHLAADPIQRQDYEFSAAIPERDAEYDLDVQEGRGRVRLVQRPNSGNDYTAIILLDDSDDGGASDYELTLSWKRPRRGEHEFDGMFRWRGRVDIGCRIAIRGKESKVEDEGGKGSQQYFAEFSAALPPREVPVSLRKVKGRGKVRLVDSPSSENGYRAVVQIEDDKGGADTYEFELGWRR